jgi:hypothetical protein
MSNPTLEKHIDDLCQQKAALIEKNAALDKEVQDLTFQNKVMIASNQKRIRLIDKEIEELKPTQTTQP